MARSIRRTASFTVELPLAEARALFTPEGERGWVHGWEPSYPAPERGEEPGAVFVTRHGERETVWVTVDATREAVRYARVAAGADAGTVHVACEEAAADRTTVTVTYVLTALTPHGEAHLDAFAAGYDDAIAGWGREIAAALADGRIRRAGSAAG